MVSGEEFAGGPARMERSPLTHQDYGEYCTPISGEVSSQTAQRRSEINRENRRLTKQKHGELKKDSFYQLTMSKPFSTK